MWEGVQKIMCRGRGQPPTSSQFFAHPRCAPSLTHFSLACLISAWKRKVIGFYAGYFFHQLRLTSHLVGIIPKFERRKSIEISSLLRASATSPVQSFH